MCALKWILLRIEKVQILTLW